MSRPTPHTRSARSSRCCARHTPRRGCRRWPGPSGPLKGWRLHGHIPLCTAARRTSCLGHRWRSWTVHVTPSARHWANSTGRPPRHGGGQPPNDARATSSPSMAARTGQTLVAPDLPAGAARLATGRPRSGQKPKVGDSTPATKPLSGSTTPASKIPRHQTNPESHPVNKDPDHHRCVELLTGLRLADRQIPLGQTVVRHPE